MIWALILYVLGFVPTIVSLRRETTMTRVVGTVFWPMLSALTLVTMFWPKIKRMASTYLTFTWR